MYVVFPMIGASKSGGTRALFQLANGLIRRGHRVSILIARPSGLWQFPLDPAVEILTMQKGGDIFRELWWLTRHIPRDADAMIASYYPTAYPTALAASQGRSKAFYFVQGYEPRFFLLNSNRKSPWLQRVLAKASYRLPLRKAAVSVWLQRELASTTRQQIPVIHVGVDTDLFSPAASFEGEKSSRTVMTIGSRNPGKGFGDFVDSMKQMAKRIPGVRAMVVTQDRHLNVNAPVPAELVYPLDDAELVQCYRRADVFVFSSKLEGFGLPPLEAMACGTPVVTTDCRGVLEFAQDGVNCLMVPPCAPTAMAEAILAVLNDQAFAAGLVEAGLETARRFTWDAMVDRFEKVLQSP